MGTQVQTPNGLYGVRVKERAIRGKPAVHFVPKLYDALRDEAFVQGEPGVQFKVELYNHSPHHAGFEVRVHSHPVEPKTAAISPSLWLPANPYCLVVPPWQTVNILGLEQEGENPFTFRAPQSEGTTTPDHRSVYVTVYPETEPYVYTAFCTLEKAYGEGAWLTNILEDKDRWFSPVFRGNLSRRHRILGDAFLLRTKFDLGLSYRTSAELEAMTGIGPFDPSCMGGWQSMQGTRACISVA